MIDKTLTLAEWLAQTLPLLMNRQIRRIDGYVTEGDVIAYWAGSVLRIDLKPCEDR